MQSHKYKKDNNRPSSVNQISLVHNRSNTAHVYLTHINIGIGHCITEENRLSSVNQTSPLGPHSTIMTKPGTHARPNTTRTLEKTQVCE